MTRSYARIAAPQPTYAELDGDDAWALDAAPWSGGRRTGARVSGARLCPVEPSKIVCVGRNYRAHAAELGNEVPEKPLLFFKPPSSLLAPGGTIVLPPPSLSERVEHEVELGLVIGRRACKIDVTEAGRAIFGYTVVGDITARDLQRRDKQWTRAKGMDTFCPVGPVVATLEPRAATSLAIRCWVNDELRQDGDTSAMVFSPAQLVSYISQAMTLEPGDLVATGTPEGVGPLVAGDRLRMHIDGVGTLEVDVA